jgi:hypothetical protein
MKNIYLSAIIIAMAFVLPFSFGRYETARAEGINAYLFGFTALVAFVLLAYAAVRKDLLNDAPLKKVPIKEDPQPVPVAATTIAFNDLSFPLPSPPPRPRILPERLVIRKPSA